MKLNRAKQSGMLQGGGGTRDRHRRRKGTLKSGIPNVHITNAQEVKRLPDFEPGVDYSQRELHLLAEKMILCDPKPLAEHPAVLSMEKLARRQRREVYTANGTPDPSFVQGIFWRTHPDGRKVNSDEQRVRNGASFYRG